MLSLTSGGELRRFRRGRLPRLAVAAMLLVPLLYGALYLWAFWNPTGHLDAMPVALVNADAGAGAQTGAGDRRPRPRRGSSPDDGRPRLEWSRMRPTRRRAYATATTTSRSPSPTDFSADLVSAGGDDPTSAQIDVTYNDANSFIGTTLGRSAMDPRA